MPVMRARMSALNLSRRLNSGFGLNNAIMRFVKAVGRWYGLPAQIYQEF
jgi:hypothetical protein